MTVEVNDSDWAVGLVHTAQQGQSNGVVATHGNDTREGLAMLRLASNVGIGSGFTHENAVVTFFDLLNSPLVVVSDVWSVISPRLAIFN